MLTERSLMFGSLEIAPNHARMLFVNVQLSLNSAVGPRHKALAIQYMYLQYLHYLTNYITIRYPIILIITLYMYMFYNACKCHVSVVVLVATCMHAHSSYLQATCICTCSSMCMGPGAGARGGSCFGSQSLHIFTLNEDELFLVFV